jgi:hypothetical protein
MVHHGFAVGRKLQVGLDREAALDRRPESGRGVLDHARGGIVQAAMCNGLGGEPVKTGHELLCA